MKYNFILKEINFIFLSLIFYLKDIFNYLSKNNLKKGNNNSNRTTFNYVEKYLSNVNPVKSRKEIHKSALLETFYDEGLVMELGVYSGYTINMISKLKPDWEIHGFDSFYGLPEDWRQNWKKGKFNRKGVKPEVNKNIILHSGYTE